MKKKIVIFDLDGTILDTIGDIAAALNRALAAFGAPEHTSDEVKSYIGNGSMMLMRRALPEGASDEECIALRERFREEYKSDMYSYTLPYSGISELLAELKSLGATVAVITNKDDAAAGPMIAHYFRNYVDYCRGVRTDFDRKPSPVVTNSMLNELGFTADEALFVGDGMADFEVSGNCGIDYIPIGYGYVSPSRLESVSGKKPCMSVAELRGTLLRYFK